MKCNWALLFAAVILLAYPDFASAQQQASEMQSPTVGRISKPVEAETLDRIRKSAEQGNSSSQLKLGRMYLRGEGVPQDYVKGVKWIRRAAQDGNGTAQLELGMMYLQGNVVLQSYEEAAKWLRRPAENGNTTAQDTLGRMYLQGNIVPKNYEEAAKWLRGLAAQGNIAAQVALGKAYFMGDLISQDYAEAAKWLSRAAEQGDASAQCMLGTLYGEGKGVSQDYVQAHMWLNLCADSAKGAMQETAAKFRDGIAKQMKPHEIEEAKKIASEWKPVRMPSPGLPADTKVKGPVFALGNGVTLPEILYKPLPGYTKTAREARVEGIVLIQCIVRKDGTVDHFKILRGLGYGLDEAAIDLIAHKWRFKPGTRDGVPVDVQVFIEVKYDIY